MCGGRKFNDGICIFSLYFWRFEILSNFFDCLCCDSSFWAAVVRVMWSNVNVCWGEGKSNLQFKFVWFYCPKRERHSYLKSQILLAAERKIEKKSKEKSSWVGELILLSSLDWTNESKVQSLFLCIWQRERALVLIVVCRRGRLNVCSVNSEKKSRHRRSAEKINELHDESFWRWKTDDCWDFSSPIFLLVL